MFLENALDAARSNVDAKRIKVDEDEGEELAISVRWEWKFSLSTSCLVNPLSPRSDFLVTYPCNICTLSSQKVIRILRLIRKISCYLDLTPNSHNLFKRKCVPVIGEN